MLGSEKRGFGQDNDEDKKILSKYFRSTRLRKSFYEKDCVDLAKSLLGKTLCRCVGDTVLQGMIVETESYLGEDKDGASHSFQGKRTDRNAAMYENPGSCYVYKIYGNYHCFNITSKGEGSAVLIRAIEALTGQQTMIENRSKRRKDGGHKLKIKDLSNGPSKLCDALNITKEEINFESLIESNDIWLEENENSDEIEMVTTTRIGIEGAGEPWSRLPLRFYMHGNKSVSVRDKKAETELNKNKDFSS